MPRREANKSESKEWEFQIHTDSYAGNFERELCGYITGMVSETSSHGEAEAKLFYEEMGLFDRVLEQIRDDDDTEKGADPWEGITVSSFDEDLENPFCGYVCEVADDHGNYRPCAVVRHNNVPNTVEIHFEQKPTEELIRIMMERSHKWVNNYSQHPRRFGTHATSRILGFALLERTITMKTVWENGPES